MFQALSTAAGPLAQGRLPAVCAPLVAPTRQALAEEARAVAAKRPDLLEWRVDFFERIADTQEVLAAARAVREAAGALPLLFTRRSQREGGQPIALDEAGVLALARTVCAAGACELLDWEMESEAAHLEQVRAFTRAAGVRLVLSFHDFSATPEQAALAARYRRAAELGADVAKIAVMPRSEEDLLALLSATLEAARSLPIPVAGMAMGGLGALTRVAGGVFGSALTFAVGQNASAPGQVAIDDLRTALAVLERARG
jgi:3-dehydroquinate dehydratase I